ncbi:MAG: hypothetical protein R3E21_08110 [Caenibius sp.]
MSKTITAQEAWTQMVELHLVAPDRVPACVAVEYAEFIEEVAPKLADYEIEKLIAFGIVMIGRVDLEKELDRVFSSQSGHMAGRA